MGQMTVSETLIKLAPTVIYQRTDYTLEQIRLAMP